MKKEQQKHSDCIARCQQEEEKKGEATHRTIATQTLPGLGSRELFEYSQSAPAYLVSDAPRAGAVACFTLC